MFTQCNAFIALPLPLPNGLCTAFPSIFVFMALILLFPLFPAVFGSAHTPRVYAKWAVCFCLFNRNCRKWIYRFMAWNFHSLPANSYSAYLNWIYNCVAWENRSNFLFYSFLFRRCQYYIYKYPWVPAYQGVITFFVIANFTLATFMDPGVIPKGKGSERSSNCL